MNAAFEFLIDGIFIILSIYHAAGVHREYKWELVSLLRCIRQHPLVVQDRSNTQHVLDMHLNERLLFKKVLSVC